jgi:hypothetical protein
MSYDGTYRTTEDYKGKAATPTNNNNNNSNNAQNNSAYPYGKASETTGNIKYGMKNSQAVRAIQYALQKLGYDIGPKGVDGWFGDYTLRAVKKFQKDTGITQDGIVGNQTRAKFKMKKYKTGGLADFTGPAWLDGTKARPELILNQRDTENFIQLKNVLASLMSGSAKSSENTGDNTYDIDINVESIGSDYDVDQLAEKVKSLINDTARYRNNNAISRMR